MSTKKDPTILDDNADWYAAFQDGSVSAADVAKATGEDKADVQATLDDMVSRQIVETDPEFNDKTPRYRLTRVGQARMSSVQPTWSVPSEG